MAEVESESDLSQPYVEFANTYDPTFRRHAHQLLAWGYQDSRTRINSNHEETEITGFIAEAVGARLSDPETDAHFDRYNIKEDNPASGEERTGKARRRIDILIEDNSSKPRPHYIFEAKRLRTGSHPISKYIGEEGVTRFIDSRYASVRPEAAMIGYVQTNDAAHWSSRLKSGIDKAAEKLGLEKSLTQVPVIDDLQDEYLSVHKRQDKSQINIFHIFLDCT
jgi:hypothetical protein